MAVSHKSKQYLVYALKVFILVITFGYIYSKLTNTNQIAVQDFFSSLRAKGLDSLPYFLFFLVLTATNWFFEILKWKTLASQIEHISLKRAAKESLAALTVSLATPNRIGEYGAKAYFYSQEKRKRILLLNFIGNTCQMLVTMLFGVVGLAMVISKYSLSFSVLKIIGLLAIILCLFIGGWIFKEKEWLFKGLSIQRVLNYFTKISRRTNLSILLYSVLRYLSFSCLFYLLLQFFDAEITILVAYPIIVAMYLLVSIVPTLFILDVVVRGGIATWLFSLAGVPELITLSTVLAIWLLNFVLPAILGSFYVITYSPKKA